MGKNGTKAARIKKSKMLSMILLQPPNTLLMKTIQPNQKLRLPAVEMVV